MKVIFTLLITIVLYNSIVCVNYDLVNGTEKIVSSLQPKETYIFYIQAQIFYGATIDVSFKSENSLAILYLYTYESASKTISNYLKKNSFPISPKKVNGEYLTTVECLVNKNATQYFAVEVKPSYAVSDFRIKINFENVAIDLTNGIPKNIKISNKDYHYYLFVKSTMFQVDLFKITTYKKFLSSSLINIYEFKSKSTNYITKNLLYFTSSTKNDEKIYSLKYPVNSLSTEYVALEIIPDSDIDIVARVDVMGGAYDISQGISNTVNNLTAGYNYYFFLPSSLYENHLFNLTMNNMNQRPFQYLYVNGYVKKDEKEISSETQSVTILSTINKELFASFTHTTVYNDTKYIALVIKPNYNISYITINYEGEKCAYNLSDGIPLNLTKIISGYKYFFFIPNTLYQNDSISLIMNKKGSNPIASAIFKELENRSSTNHLSTSSQSIYASTENNEMISNFSYFISQLKARYLSLILKFNNDLDYMSIKINIEGCLYDLSEHIPLNVTNLKAGFSYYFFIPAVKYQNQIINLQMNNMNKQPFSLVNIQEREGKASASLKSISQSVAMKTENNELVSSITYYINNFDTKYLALLVTPDYDIDYITLKVEIAGGSYDLSSGVPLNLTELKSGFSYYFFISASLYDSAAIDLTWEHMSNQPFSYVNIYEHSIKSSFILNTTKQISTTIQNSKIISSFAYSIKNDTTKLLALEIKPTDNIDNFVINIDVQKHLYILDNGVPANIVNVKSGYAYYFIVSSSLFEINSLILTMSNTKSKALSEVEIFEYSSSDISKITYLQSAKKSVTTSTRNNELTSRLAYTTTDSKTKYVCFKIEPINDLNYLEAKIYVDFNQYYLEYEEEKAPIFSLKGGAKYYIYITLDDSSKKIKITLTMNNDIYTSPFSSLTIYESDAPTSNARKVSIDKEEIANESGDSTISFSYEYSLRRNIVLEIIPNYDIDYLITEFKYVSYVWLGLLIVFSIIGGIIVTLIIMFCIKRHIRRKKAALIGEGFKL